jgi:predicted RecA/RadA family phage recombinase
MIQFIQDGNSIDHSPLADVPAGTAVAVGEMVGITKVPIPANTPGTLSLVGVYDIAKEPAVPIPAGTKVFLDAVGQFASPDDSGGARPYLGMSTQDAAADDETVRFRLNH